MSLAILAQGRLLADPVARTSKSGKPFATITMLAHIEDGEPVNLSGIAFDTTVIAVLEKLSKGENVAITGRARLSTWESRDGTTRTGLSVVVDAILTTYAIRKRRASAKTSPNQNACEGQGYFSDEEMEF